MNAERTHLTAATAELLSESDAIRIRAILGEACRPSAFRFLAACSPRMFEPDALAADQLR